MHSYSKQEIAGLNSALCRLRIKAANGTVQSNLRCTNISSTALPIVESVQSAAPLSAGIQDDIFVGSWEALPTRLRLLLDQAGWTRVFQRS